MEATAKLIDTLWHFADELKLPEFDPANAPTDADADRLQEEEESEEEEVPAPEGEKEGPAPEGEEEGPAPEGEEEEVGSGDVEVEDSEEDRRKRRRLDMLGCLDDWLTGHFVKFERRKKRATQRHGTVTRVSRSDPMIWYNDESLNQSIKSIDMIWYDMNSSPNPESWSWVLNPEFEGVQGVLLIHSLIDSLIQLIHAPAL